jgi:dihydrofolate reductase
MSKVTADISVSLDGFAAGPNQSLEKPFGDGVEDETLHTWMFEEAEAKANAAEIAAITTAKAYVMGRNMFSPGRGDWDLDWKGWWGDDPPYHAPVFVLTHHPREPLTMEGGTTYHFVTDGIESALAQAKAAAGDGDVSIAGGAATLRQCLAIGAIDELRLHVVPLVLGEGENVFTGLRGLRLEAVERTGTGMVTHVIYRPTSHLPLT